ncbi:hypothetical protein A3SI_16545 [Nitritalea halalkaliphila LW7]|uniref:Zincin peptidase n=1 Tax=Nitritalea halalkaliphila LW7 TaxID=1189621 RepID=I5BX17_9BACT|nr:DUF3267 domain-containing protein [Nitritalea halalkaliphila]EIM74119.1 hypothetical protein A3SI_16545 [Nitritalea halalkaliphila LW7]
MKITPENLAVEKYRLVEKLEHHELIPFVKNHLNKWSYVSITFYLINIAFLLLGILSIYFCFQEKSMGWDDIIFYYTFGFTVCFLLIPIHECIHILAYRALGATETSLDYNLKKLYFAALANNFVVNRREFAFVALLPFICITLSLLTLYFFVNTNWQLTILATLLLHTSMCSGDFGIVNYFITTKDPNIVTYDDTKNKISYFMTK